MTFDEYKVALSVVNTFAGAGDNDWDSRYLEALKTHGLELKSYDYTDELSRDFTAPLSFSKPLTWSYNTRIGVI